MGGLVINLANTKKYYTWNYHHLRANGFGDVQYRHLPIEGRIVPDNWTLDNVLNTMHEFFTENPDKLIGIHCTHGVNRTAFFVLAYLLRYCGPKSGGQIDGS